MTKYSYRVLDDRGEQKVGTIEAASRDEALHKLRQERNTVIELHDGSAPVDIESMRIRHAARNVKREEVIAFSSQVAVMLETGVPLIDALTAYTSNARASGLKRVMTAVQESVQSGASFSSSIGAFPRVFPNLMVSLMRASEASGTMGLMLRRVSDYLAKERRTTRQIKGALAYPTAMIGMALAVTVFLVIWVLPRFARIYESRSATLPTPTRIVMVISNVLIGQWPIILAAIGALVVGFFAARTTRRGKYAIDWIKLHAPIVGPMFTQFYLTRATRTLATLLAAGVTLVDSVKIVRGVTDNALWLRLWEQVHDAITGGYTIAEVVTQSKLIPPHIAQMIAAGERTGKLPETLDRIAEVTEQDLDEAIKSGTQMIEPIMISVMGALIGGLAIALLLPIFSIGSAMTQ